MSKDLIAALDEAASKLLDEACSETSDGSEKQYDLAEKIGVFNAVAKWAKERHVLIPPKPSKDGNKFDSLRRKLDGPKTRGRRDPGKEERISDDSASELE